MTKEMRPSHRVDVLVDALLLYSRHSAHKLGTFGAEFSSKFIFIYTATLLPSRMTKALKIQEKSRHELEVLMTASQG